MNFQDKAYKETAFYYDCDNRDVVTSDIGFILEMAERFKPKRILELACGTGRVTIPLIKAGFDVTGVDLSPQMLKTFKEKTITFTEEEKNRTSLFEDSMVDFQSGKKFDLVIIPFHTFQLLKSEEDALGCLTNIKNNLLEKGGRFFINVFRPFDDMASTWRAGASHIQFEIHDDRGFTLQKINKNDFIDTKKQIFWFYHIYNITFDNGEKKLLQDYMGIKYYKYEQIKELLESTGFAIEEEYGWYDKSPINVEREFIFICK